MGKTPTDFYAQFNNKRVNHGEGWNDSKFGYQCVAGFKCFCEWAGIPVQPTPNNWADGYWYSRNKLGFSKYFDYITGSKNFKNGDWVIWAYGSKSHPKSHIAMYYNGYEFGQNQGGDSGFRLIKTDFSDALGALRWKGFEQKVAQLKGIDISNWQKGIDLSKVQCDFVIVKATEGTTFIDKYCDGFYQQAKKLGKKLGFYHFARPEKNDPIAEADFFYKNTKNYFGEAIPVLDWESEGKSNVSWALQWLDHIYKLTGVKPMIYMSESVVNSYDWSKVVTGDYGLWVAKYRDNQPDYNYDMSNAGSKPSVKWWTFYAMWQWTSSGRLDGYSGNLDCDVFYGNAETWDKYAGVKTMKNGWMKDGQNWLYYSEGKPVKGWHKLKWSKGKDWFYFNKNGIMMTGWIRWKNNWYYCDEKTGAMLTGDHMLPCHFNASGALERI